jgi:hypothetical protein
METQNGSHMMENSKKSIMTWTEFLETLDGADMIECISDFETYCSDGFIGDCVLRRHAQVWKENMGGVVSLTQVMSDIATHCYRIFAHRWLGCIQGIDIKKDRN